MSVGVTSAILASVVSLTVAVAVLFRRPWRNIYGHFSAFTFSLFFWHSAALASRLSGTPLFTLQAIAAALIPPTAAFFFRELLRDPSPGSRRLAVATVPVSLLLLVGAFSPWGEHWAFQAALLLYVAAALLLVARAMYHRIRSAKTDVDRKRLSYVFYGGLGALVLAGGELVPGSAVPAAMGHVAVTFYVYFLYQSIMARRLIDLVELLGKAAVLGVLTLVLATVYSLLVLWVGADEPGLWLFNTLVASFVILILYDQVRPWIERATTRLLFQQRFELRQAVERLVRKLRTIVSLEQMRDDVLDTLVSSGRVEHAAIYLPADGEIAFELLGHRGGRPPQMLTMAEHPTLLIELRKERRPLLREHLENRRDELPALTDGDPTSTREMERTSEAIATLDAFRATVILPMLVEERIVGLLSVGPESAGDSYATDEIAALMSAAEACAVVITNSREYDRTHQRERLAAIGEMATGMAHEIRNPLGAIKGAAQCLDPQQLPPESVEFLDVIVEEVDRLDTVVTQFLEYARPYRGSPEATDVNAIVTATLRLLGSDPLPANVELVSDLAHRLPEVFIDPEQLKQVLINLTLNGVQAMPEGGRITIHTGVSHEHEGDLTGEMERAGLRTDVLLQVSDTGGGIRPEDLPHIFVPFFTTKDSGTGLGLCIIQRIIESVGGRIEVATHVGEGTTFTARLPALAEATATATHTEAATATATQTEAATATATATEAAPAEAEVKRRPAPQRGETVQ